MYIYISILQCVAVWLQCVAVCCSVLQAASDTQSPPFNSRSLSKTRTRVCHFQGSPSVFGSLSKETCFRSKVWSSFVLRSLPHCDKMMQGGEGTLDALSL